MHEVTHAILRREGVSDAAAAGLEVLGQLFTKVKEEGVNLL